MCVITIEFFYNSYQLVGVHRLNVSINSVIVVEPAVDKILNLIQRPFSAFVCRHLTLYKHSDVVAPNIILCGPNE